MRQALCALGIAATILACSSGTEGDDCAIAGTYAVTGAAETGNTCPDSINETTTYTISPTGDTFAVELQGVQGSCIGRRIEACKIQGKCDLASRDPVSPNNAIGTLQFSWTFVGDGFKGSATVTIPPAVSLPGGCSGTSAQTGVRR